MSKKSKKTESSEEQNEEPVLNKEEEEEEEEEEKRAAATNKLRKILIDILSNPDLNSKERRSAKRKAKAIAAEEAGCPVSELMSEEEMNSLSLSHKTEEEITKVEDESQKKEERLKRKKDENELRVDDEKESKQNDKKLEQKPTKKRKPNHNPYILFIGQLSYTTTKQQLFEYVQSKLGSNLVTPQTVQIRLRTHPKTHKSLGMAFLETTTPELLYKCLTLHHTHLDGRRINVEKSAGGKKQRPAKIAQFRKQQKQYISDTVTRMLDEYKNNGDIQEGELDDGVIELCKRHSTAVVDSALAEYVQDGGKDKKNPSAFLTHLIGKIATDDFDRKLGQKKGNNFPT